LTIRTAGQQEGVWRKLDPFFVVWKTFTPFKCSPAHADVQNGTLLMLLDRPGLQLRLAFSHKLLSSGKDYTFVVNQHFSVS
jgi:hypothetical protein